MRHKTYLTPTQQLTKTLELIVDKVYEDDYFGVLTAVVVRPHRLFRVGDIVGVRLSNGQASRYPVYGVSSKGRKVLEHYLGFRHDVEGRNWNRRPWVEERLFKAKRVKIDHGIFVPETCKMPDQSSSLQHIKDVVLAWTTDPTSQRFLVERLRASVVDQAVSANISLNFPPLC